MTPATRAPRSLAALALLAALASLALLAGPARAAYQSESYGEYEAQLRSGQIRAATINRHVRSIRITLADGRLVLAHYAAHQEPTVLRALQARHVPVTLLTPTQVKAELKKKPVHHKIRYIAGGVLIVLIVIGLGIFLYNRRRMRDEY